MYSFTKMSKTQATWRTYWDSRAAWLKSHSVRGYTLSVPCVVPPSALGRGGDFTKRNSKVDGRGLVRSYIAPIDYALIEELYGPVTGSWGWASGVE